MRLSKRPSGKELNWFACRSITFRWVRLSKIPSGNELNWLPPTPSATRLVSWSKSPSFSPVIWLSDRSSSGIAARCASVTSLAEFTPAAATIASRTSGVRSATGVFPLDFGGWLMDSLLGRTSVSRLVRWSKSLSCKLNGLSLRMSFFRLVRLSKRPSGKELNWLLFR